MAKIGYIFISVICILLSLGSQQALAWLIVDFRSMYPHMVLRGESPQGPLIQVLQYAANVNKLKLDFTLRSLGASIDGLQTQKTHIIPKIYYDKDLEKYATFIGPIQSENRSIRFLLPVNSPLLVANFTDLYKLRVGVCHDLQLTSELETLKPHVFSNCKRTLQALENGAVDIIASDHSEAILKMIELDRFQGLRYARLLLSQPDKFYIAFAKQSENNTDLQKIQKTVQVMLDSGIVQKIYNEDKEHKLQLTMEEKNYISQLPSIRYCMNPEWLPFEAVRDNYPKGVMSDLIYSLSNHLNTPFELVSTDINECLSKLKNNEVDFVSTGLVHKAIFQATKESAPYFRYNLAVITKNIDIMLKLSTVSRYKIGIGTNSLVWHILTQKYPNHTFIPTETPGKALRAVQAGQLDATVLPVPVASYYLSGGNYANLLINDTQDMTADLVLRVRKDNALLLSIFNKAIANLHPEDIENFLRKSSAIKLVQTVDNRIIYLITMSCLIILALFWAWNRYLKKITNKFKYLNIQLQSLLDNSEQGFLAFKKDLLVDPIYSKQCERFFAHSLAKKNISQLLFPNNEAKRLQWQKNMYHIFEETNKLTQDLYLSLLPTEVYLGNMILKAHYSFLSNNMCLIILTDLSKQRQLENRLSEETLKLRFIVSSLRDQIAVCDVVHDYNQFFQHSCLELLGQGIVPRRELHTLKGLLAQLEFPELPNKIHELETSLLTANAEQAQAIFANWNYHRYLNEDLNSLLELVPNFLHEQRTCVLLQKDTISLHDQAQALLPELDKILNPQIYTTQKIFDLCHQVIAVTSISFQSLLQPYVKLVEQLAIKQHKLIAPVEIIGDTITVHPFRYLTFTKSLVHVFRNVVVHATQSPEIRQIQGKTPALNLKCTIQTTPEGFCLTIQDDGAGINLEALRQQLIIRQNFNPIEVEKMEKSQVLAQIFMDNISLSSDVNTLSGRGIGLPAVKSALDDLGGSVAVFSELNVGTTIIFNLK